MARGGVTDGVPWGGQIDELRKLGKWPMSDDQELISDDPPIAAPDAGSEIEEGQILKTQGFDCCEGDGSYRVFQGEWQCQHCGECWPLDYPMREAERIP